MKQSLHVISLMDKTYGVDSHSCKLPFFLWVNEGLEGLNNIFRVSSVQSLSCVWLFVTPWIAACQTSLSITNSQSLLKLMSIELVMPSISSSVVRFFSCLQSFPASGYFQMSQFFSSGSQSIGISASASVLPMNTQNWSPLGWTGWISLQSKGLSRVFSNSSKASILWRSAFFMA